MANDHCTLNNVSFEITPNKFTSIQTVDGFCGVSGCKSKHKTTKGYCPKHYAQMRKFGAIQPDRQRIKKNCEWCGKGFDVAPSNIKAKTCSQSCSSKLKAKNRGHWIKEHNVFNCAECGSDFTRVKKNLHNSEAKYCSRECFFVAANRQAKEAEYQSKIERLVNREVSLLNKIGRNQRLRFEKINCKQCNEKILKSERVAWFFCSDKCHKENLTESKKLYRKTPQYKAQRRKHKASRIARIRGASRIERFDPFYIFERDKWTCKCCGVKTPKKLRGTIEDNAPELDHIIPISLGGTHTKDNAQLLCRACNISKSNGNAQDQMLLFG
jgi:5-methylcytosine-specific restriction endonuclease McrA